MEGNAQVDVEGSRDLVELLEGAAERLGLTRGSTTLEVRFQDGRFEVAYLHRQVKRSQLASLEQGRMIGAVSALRAGR